jgi:acyl carrier protein
VGHLGTPGQGHYAGASAFLDALARLRREQGLPGTSLAWGLWERAGEMTGRLDRADLVRVRRGGVLPLTDEEGLALLDAALATGDSVVATARLDLPALRQQAAAGLLPPVLRRLAGTTARRSTGADGEAPLAERLAGLTEQDRRRVILDVVRAQVATVLGHAAPGVVDADAAFKDLGFDSLTAVELRNRLGAATGLRLPATLVFDHPTPTALAAQVEEMIAAGTVPPVLAELERLEAALLGLDAAEAERLGISVRLHALMSRLKIPAAMAAGALESATADEIFDLIDTDLGRAPS